MISRSLFRRQPLVLLAVVFLLLSCNLSKETTTTSGVQNTEAPAGQTAAVEGNTPAAGETPAVAATTESPPADTAKSPPTATSTIVHLTTPSGPSGTTRYITDISSKDDAPQKKAPSGWDLYQNNRYERPFTANEMAYLPDVDLTRVEMRIESPWVYITFQFVEPRAAGLGQTMYGAEFDLNKDGRGDYLIWGASPSGAAWTTDGVEVWKDSNYDVGGPTPQATDAPWMSGNGYDQKLFSSGVGSDPDLAWSRQIEGGAKVQLAFKYSAIGSAPQFLWNGLADGGVRNPAWFDYNDHFTQAEAGSPLPVQTNFYPLKQLFALDNTCFDAYGFTPTGTEPGLCMYYGSISGIVFRDYNENGIRDGVEPPYGSGAVQLGQGACPSSGYTSASIGASGQYAFPNIPIGAYCVRYSEPSPPALDFHLTTPDPVSVTLAADEAKTVNFGANWTDVPE